MVRRKRLGSFVENYLTQPPSELSEAGAGEERLKWVRRGSRVAAVEAVVDPSRWGRPAALAAQIWGAGSGEMRQRNGGAASKGGVLRG